MDIFSDTIFRDLEKLNFTVNESKVYLVLLSLGPTMAGRIAKETGLDRTSVYNALNSLLKNGIVSYAIEANRKVFKAENPKKITDYYKEKETISKEVVTRLKPFYEQKKETSDVTLYQNYKGLKTVFQDILDSCEKGDEYYVISSEGQFGENMPYYVNHFRKDKEAKNIRTKMLVREGREKTTKSKNTQYRALPSNVVSPATINIYKGKVAIIIWEKKPEAILIENKKVSETFKNYFDFMWKHANELPN